MTWIVALHRIPEDPAAYEKHYFETHVPLSKQMPGLRRYVTSRGPVSTPAGDSDYHMVAMLEFDDMDAMQRAMVSPEGQVAYEDTKVLTSNRSDQIEILIFDSVDV